MRYAQIKKEISPNPFKDTNIYQLKNYRCILLNLLIDNQNSILIVVFSLNIS